jgi:signal transduction histidine kinase
MDQFDGPWTTYQHISSNLTRQLETNPEQLRDIMHYIIAVGSVLRLKMDVDSLLKDIAEAACRALRFRYSALYLADGQGFFRMRATSGLNEEAESYLESHPLPDHIAAMLIDDTYRLSDSYFIPGDAAIWQHAEFTSHFVVVDETQQALTPVIPGGAPSSSPRTWLDEDLLVVPLVSSDNMLLGLLTPDAPLDGLRPTEEVMALFEVFANQAAVAIEGARLYSDLHRALEQAQESERLKNQFLMTASHELRTPITAIQGYIELLSNYHGTLDEKTKLRFLANARRACDELVLMLGNVMDASRLDQEHVALKLGPVKTLESVQTILEILEPIISREKRVVSVRIPSEDILWVDELRLRQVLLNLVGNALKYTPAGSDITITTSRLTWGVLRQRLPQVVQDQNALPAIPASGQFIAIAIRDRGPGIAPEEQPRLFNKFVRLASAIDGSQRGVGLGLYLCRQLIEAMGGSIWVESAGVPGEGSTFYVALPMYRESERQA